MMKSAEDVKVINRYSEALKRKIVEEIESGQLTTREAMEVYGVRHRRTVTGWVRKHGNHVRPTQVVRIMMKSEKERIRELEKALADSQLALLAESSVNKVLIRDYGADIKKKLSSKELEKLRELQKKTGRPLEDFASILD